MIDLVIVGGGGHAKSCIDVIELEGKYNIVGIVDNELDKHEKLLNYPILGSDDDLIDIREKFSHFFIGIGQVRNPNIRQKVFKKLHSIDAHFPNIISPLAHVSKNVTLGKGNIIMHHALINSSVHVGDFNIFNTKSLIEHDCTVGDFNHLSVSSTICGTVNVCNGCFIGANATVNNNIVIADSIFIGSGSVVNKNMSDIGIYAGNPARRYR